MVSFLILINPIALFIYIKPLTLTERWKAKYFWNIVFKASLVWLFVYSLFILTGDYLFTSIFRVDFESFRLFGGIVILSTAFLFIVNGRKSFLDMKSTLDEVAQQLALPFMVGAWSVSVSILIGNQYVWYEWLAMLVAVLLANALIMGLLFIIQEKIFTNKLRSYFDKFLGIAFRLNAFFMWTVWVDMTITAIKHLFDL